MKKDIILAGVGGQGILSIAAVIGHAALAQGLHIKQAEVHGMSQRGGDVQSNLRISSSPVASDLIPRGGADVIIAMEPMEALRYLPYLGPGGYIVTNVTPFVNIPNYPEMERIMGELSSRPRVVMLDADAISKRGANMALLGAAAGVLGIEGLEEAVGKVFEAKGETVVQANIEAFRAGQQEAKKYNAALSF